MPKRKRVLISLLDKLTAIKRLDSGETLQKVADKYGVGVSTVCEWKKNRTKIEQWCSVVTTPGTDRKTMKKGEFEKIGNSLYLWFTQQRERGVPVSGPILQHKAIDLSEELPVIEAPDKFTASDGWLSRWKKRHGIRQLTICGEKLSADSSVVTGFTAQFKKLVEEQELTPDQIYNCDETGLNFKMLPSKTLASRNERSAPGYKRSKERVTILACCNYSGRHKLPLMCVGKSAKPRAFKHIAPNVLPVYYKSQKSAWMDTLLFKNWFYEEFVPKVEKFLKKCGYPRKALLLIDNAPSHSNENELTSGNIKVMFLPPNITSLVQPMDQGVLENFKRNYRQCLLQSILDQISSEDVDLVSCLKKINLKNVVYWIADSWNKVKISTIQKSWSKLIDVNSETLLEDGEVEQNNLHDLVKQLDGCEEVTPEYVNEWVTSDDREDELTDSELIILASDKVEEQHNDNKESDDDDDEEPTSKISHSVAVEALEKALLYVEQQPTATSSDVLLIKRWKDIAYKNHLQSKQKQLDIRSFFDTDIM